MNPIVVTSMNKRILDGYGAKMIRGFSEHWHSSFQLHIYCEDDCLESSGRIVAYDLYKRQPELSLFVNRNRERGNGGSNYSYKYDAVKFAHKSYAIIDALERSSGLVVWLDASATRTRCGVA